MIADNAIPLLANEEHNELDHAVPHFGGVCVGNIVIVAILVVAIFMWFVVAKIFQYGMITTDVGLWLGQFV